MEGWDGGRGSQMVVEARRWWRGRRRRRGYLVARVGRDLLSASAATAAAAVVVAAAAAASDRHVGNKQFPCYSLPDPSLVDWGCYNLSAVDTRGCNPLFPSPLQLAIELPASLLRLRNSHSGGTVANLTLLCLRSGIRWLWGNVNSKGTCEWLCMSQRLCRD